MTLSVGPGKNVILITGPPNNGRDESLSQVLPALREKKKVGYYHVFKYMQKIAPGCLIPNLTRKNVFDISKTKLDEIREKAFSSIISDIMGSDNEIDIVSTPAVFKVPPRRFYTSGMIEGLNRDTIKRFNPALILVFIDDLLRVKQRAQKDELREGMNLNLKALAEWRESTIQIIKDYVATSVLGTQVDFIIFAKEHPARTLVDLIINEKPRIYLSYHITGQKGFEDIKRLIGKLEDSFVCLNPYAIRDWQIVMAFDKAKEEDGGEVVVDIDYMDGTKINSKIPLEEAEEAIDLIRGQIVQRDLDLISYVHATVVYHKDKTPSYGVMVEVFYSNRVERPVYVLYPFKIRLSPFFENYVKKENIVQGEEDIEKMENILVAKLKSEYQTWVTWTSN